MHPEIARERELTQFRKQHYGMFVTLLMSEPGEETLAALRKDIAPRAEAAAALHPALGQGWRTLAEALPGIDTDRASAEFLSLFSGPRRPETTPYESWYLTGHLFQRPLASVQAFMADLHLVRDESRFPDPEDALGFELEIMNWLIARQLEAKEREEVSARLNQQQRFLQEHLLVWAPAFTEDLERAKSAVLYRGIAQILRGFLAWERGRFEQRGMQPVATLAEARKQYPPQPEVGGALADPPLWHRLPSKPS